MERGGGRGRGYQGSSEPTIWYLEDQESQYRSRSFPAALEEGGGSTAYDLSQLPIVYPEDLASATVSTGNDNSYCVNFTKPLFWWRITANHIDADLAPSNGPLVPVPGLTQLSLKQLVNLQKQFLHKFHVPNNIAGRENTKERSKCNSRHARSKAWARLGHLYETRLMHAYGAIPEELLQHFRVDVYGNVVALEAEPGSPAAFSMDHIMPWSKGGLTRDENLMALSEKANEAKSDALHCFIIQLQQPQQLGTQVESQQPSPSSLSGGALLPAPSSVGKVVGHLLIKERRKGGRGRNADKPWYFLQPMPRGLQVSELIQLWQQLKDIQGSNHKNPAPGTDAAPEDDPQVLASQKQRLDTLKILLCRPWPGMLKVRHEKSKHIAADGMHSITSNFIAVAKELASALPTIELTAQPARGEAPLGSHPDSASDSLSESDTEGLEDNSRTSEDAVLSSLEEEGEEACEREEEEEEEAGQGKAGAAPPSNLISSPPQQEVGAAPPSNLVASPPLPTQRLPPIMPNTSAEKESHSFCDADLALEDDAEEDRKEEGQDRDATSSEPASPPTPPLPSDPVSGEQHNKMPLDGTFSSKQHNTMSSDGTVSDEQHSRMPSDGTASRQHNTMTPDDRAMQQSSISGTTPPPQQHPSQPLGTHSSPTDPLPSTSPMDPLVDTSSHPSDPVAHTPPHLLDPPQSPDVRARVNHIGPIQQAHQKPEVSPFETFAANQHSVSHNAHTVLQPKLSRFAPNAANRPSVTHNADTTQQPQALPFAPVVAKQPSVSHNADTTQQPGASPFDPLAANQLSVSNTPGVQQPPSVQSHRDMQQPQIGVGLQNGHVHEHAEFQDDPVREHLEPAPPAVRLASSRPKFWLPQLRHPSNPYIQLALPEIFGPELHPLPSSSGMPHVQPISKHSSIPATPIHGTSAARPAQYINTATPIGSTSVTQLHSTWAGGWDAHALPDHHPPPTSKHSSLAPVPPPIKPMTYHHIEFAPPAQATATQSQPHSKPSAAWTMASSPPASLAPPVQATAMHSLPSSNRSAAWPITHSQPAPFGLPTQAKPQAVPQAAARDINKLSAGWLRSLLSWGAKFKSALTLRSARSGSGAAAPFAAGGPNNSWSYNRVAPA